MWDVKCTVCELVDMTCFASFWMQRSHVMWFFFPRHFTDDTGLIHFSAFFTLQMTWEFVFFGYVRQLPCHLQVLYLYCIYLLTSSSVLFHAPMIQPFHPQPKKRKGRRRVHDIRWTWSTSKRQAFKIEPGKRLVIRNDKPHHVHPTRKRREMESVLGRRPP